MTISPQSLALLQRAAELRAAGTPWKDTATQLAVPIEELRQLASEHHRDYERLARRASNELFRETLAEAFSVLREHLRSPERQISVMAANTIVRYELAKMRSGTKTAQTRFEREAWKASIEHLGPVSSLKNVVREKTKASDQQDVASTEKMSPSTPQRPPANATPLQPTPATPPVAPPKPAPPATPVAQPKKASVIDTIRSKRLLEVFARGKTPPAQKGVPPTVEVDRLMTGCLAE